MTLRGFLSIISASLLLALVPMLAQRRAPGSETNPNPFAKNAEAIAQGRATYNDVCTDCHGKDGAAGDRALALGAPARRYARATDAQIHDAILHGIPGTMMPANKLSEDDAWKVAAFIRGLRGTAVDAPATGNIAHGEEIFWNKGKCGECHMIRGKGGITGPDLSDIAGVRKYTSIVDALTKARHMVATDGGTHDSLLTPLISYQPVRVTMKDGKTVQGTLRNEDSFTLQVLGSDNRLYLFERDKLKDVFYIPQSVMPTDFDKRLTKAEFQDLLAFLTRQAVPAPQKPKGAGGSD